MQRQADLFIAGVVRATVVLEEPVPPLVVADLGGGDHDAYFLLNPASIEKEPLEYHAVAGKAVQL